MSLPTFLGIGAHRCATTWLYEMLKQHPQICMAKHRKEVHFFDLYYNRGVGWYSSLWDCDEKERGEIDPNYLYKEECAERIYNVLPDVKLILILRNPVERAISHYKFYKINRAYDKGFSDLIEEKKDVLERGLYLSQIKRYLEYFSRKQMRILIFEDIKNYPLELVQKTYSFLGVSAGFVPSGLKQKKNFSFTYQHPRFYSFLRATAGWLYDNQLVLMLDLARSLGVKKIFRQKKMKTDVSEKEKSFLKKFYKNEAKELSRFLGRDLTKEWKIKL